MPQKGIQGQQIEEQSLDLTGVDGAGLTNVDAVSVAGLVVGTGANNLVQLDASSRLPAVDGSLLTGVGIDDAPQNGTYYGRLNGAWQPVLAGNGGTLTGSLSIDVLSGQALNLRSTFSNSSHSLNFENIAGSTRAAFTYSNNGDTFNISKSGDSRLEFVSGNINIMDGSSNTVVPTADDNIANKKYVDDSIYGISTRTGTGTLIISEANSTVIMNTAGAATLNIPTNASVAFPIGTQVHVQQEGIGQTTIAGAGVTIHSAGGLLSTNTQYSVILLTKKATDTWVVSGDRA